ncbi:MAG: septal ring lytic transglycosylase RlpA family protein [Rubricoccaceae bacterium]|nr:septal ring lytic transglycosylase RlpA family protein [Rubricoccaceae bacterium]
MSIVKQALPFLICVVLLLWGSSARAQESEADRQVERIERIAPGGQRAANRVLRNAVASRYARSLHGNRTANGERYNHEAMTVAHRSLPFGTYVRVVNRRNNRAVVVRVNDRGPFVRGREFDLSGGAARRLGFSGLARIQYEIVDPELLPSRQPPPPRKVKHV